MKIYTSFWGHAIRNNQKAIENQDMIAFYMKKFTESTKNIYGEVHLITDSSGYEYLKDVGFTSIDLYLDNISEEYNHIWNYGKLNSINYIAKKNEHFLHLDYDFFIFKKMPDYIESGEVVFQSRENAEYYFYGKDYFIKNCKNKYLTQEFDYKNEITAYNCGIMGGRNCSFFKEYTESSLKMINDLENKNFWFKNWKQIPKYKEFTKCILAEQYYAYLYCKQMNITPTLFWDTDNYDPKIKFFLENGAFHLYGRYKIQFYKKIKAQLGI
jgi:hypothetical protein